MNYATNFAIVKNGTVTNLLRGLVYNTMDDFPNAVHTENLDVQIGDTYENGVFMRDGQVVTGGNVGVQSDWNQNDDTQPDYVKNRPFYTGDPVETVLVEESTATFTESGGKYTTNFPSTFEATVGETYSVSWDGTAYECTCVSSNNMTLIGNLSIAGAGSDTGEPFVMMIKNGNYIIIGTADTSSTHTFSISQYSAGEVVKIDRKYLPPRLKDPLIIDATNLPSDTSGWSELYNQIDGAYNERREILLDLHGNGTCMLPCVSCDTGTALFLKSSTDYSKINVYILTAYVSDGGSFTERVITLTAAS